MAIYIRYDADSGITALTMSGLLTRADYRKALPHLEAIADDTGPLKLLVVAASFEGWAPADLQGEALSSLGDVSQVGRVAIIAPPMWQRVLVETSQRACSAPCRLFQEGGEKDACQWLESQLIADAVDSSRLAI